MNELEELRRELNHKQQEVVALISDISDAETRLSKLKKEVTGLYLKIDEKLNCKEN